MSDDLPLAREIDEARGRLAEVVESLAAADPVYDYMNCFFCKALAPIPPVNRGPAWEERCEEHEDDCPWWMARRLLGLPPWPSIEQIGGSGWTVRVGDRIIRGEVVDFEPAAIGEVIEAWAPAQGDPPGYARVVRRGFVR